MTFNKKQNDFIKEVTQKNKSDYTEQSIESFEDCYKKAANELIKRSSHSF